MCIWSGNPSEVFLLNFNGQTSNWADRPFCTHPSHRAWLAVGYVVCCRRRAHNIWLCLRWRLNSRTSNKINVKWEFVFSSLYSFFFILVFGGLLSPFSCSCNIIIFSASLPKRRSIFFFAFLLFLCRITVLAVLVLMRNIYKIQYRFKMQFETNQTKNKERKKRNSDEHQITTLRSACRYGARAHTGRKHYKLLSRTDFTTKTNFQTIKSHFAQCSTRLQLSSAQSVPMSKLIDSNGSTCHYRTAFFLFVHSTAIKAGLPTDAGL